MSAITIAHSIQRIFFELSDIDHAAASLTMLLVNSVPLPTSTLRTCAAVQREFLLRLCRRHSPRAAKSIHFAQLWSRSSSCMSAICKQAELLQICCCVLSPGVLRLRFVIFIPLNCLAAGVA